MSLAEIEKKILEEARAEAAAIQAEAEAAAAKETGFHQQRMAELTERFRRETAEAAARLERSILVPARLQARRLRLEEQRRLLDELYNEVAGEKKISPAELDRLKEDSEVAAAAVLFGEGENG